MIIVVWGKENSELPLWIKSAASHYQMVNIYTLV